MHIDEIMRLTRNFYLHEFDCPDGTPIPEEILPTLTLLANRLQVVRDLNGSTPLTVSSGWRSEEHNERIGGSKGSYHLRGAAADINRRCFKFSTLELLWSHWSGGMGLYDGHVHLDIRDRKERWDKQS